MFEQRVRHHLDFVKAHVLIQFSQASGKRRGDEMDRVSASGEFLSEFRANNAAPAVRGIDRNADVHDDAELSTNMRRK
jgi:hypothetical protein